MLVVRDEGTRMLFSMKMPHRRIGLSWPSKEWAKFIKELGYTRAVIRTDGEHTITALVGKLRDHGLEVIPERTPVGDSQADARAEQAVQSCECQMRTMKIALERRLKVTVPTAHPLMAWLVQHAADTMNRCALDRAGRTPYHLLKGKPFNGLVWSLGSVAISGFHQRKVAT